AAPEQAVLEQAALEQAALEQAALEQAALEQAALEQAALEQAAPAQLERQAAGRKPFPSRSPRAWRARACSSRRAKGCR
ncbi:MAG TPA: hypothetical protein VGK73_32165, partial [Polyangiaceae bacterium]